MVYLGWMKLQDLRVRGKLPIRQQDAPTVLQTQHKRGDNQILLVFGQTRLTNTLAKSIEKTSEAENCMKETSQNSTKDLFPITTLSLADSLARLSALLDGGEDLKILGELYSSTFAELRKQNDLAICFLRTSKVFLITKKAAPSELSSAPWMNWGMMRNGKCLTARISESHKTASGCSLSQVLEAQVDEKYFLSDKSMEYLKRALERKRLRISIPQLLPQTTKKAFIQGVKPTQSEHSGPTKTERDSEK